MLAQYGPWGHTYIIGHYMPSVRIIDLLSHTTYVVCVLTNDRFFKKLFMAILFTLAEEIPILF